MRTRSIALDVEFVKSQGKSFARSVALVPFVASTCSPDALQTAFHEAPTVVSLCPAEVMRRADVLPCGHLLEDHMRKTLVQGDALEAIRLKYVEETENLFHEFQQARRAQKGRASDGHQTLSCSSETLEPVITEEVPQSSDRGTPADHDSGLSSSIISHSLTPQEAMLKKTLQIRTGIARFHQIFDPYGIPNIRRHHVEAVKMLYTASPDSPDFISASQHISPLRQYGRGKGRQKALAFLSRYYPQFLHEILRSSFASAEAWCKWLKDCAALVEDDLKAVHELHRSGGHQIPGSDGGVGLRFVECDSLDSLSIELNRSWQRHVQGSSNLTKFFAYGNADSTVVHRTLQKGCSQLILKQFSERAVKAGSASASSVSTPSGSSLPMQPVPADVMLSPYQAKVLDITGHALFAASGFKTPPKKVPPLSEALQKCTTKDSTAMQLWDIQRAHDPLWDAQALACICVGCGAVR